MADRDTLRAEAEARAIAAAQAASMETSRGGSVRETLASGAKASGKGMFTFLNRIKPKNKPVHPDALLRSGQMQEKMGTKVDFDRQIGNPNGGKMTVRDLYFFGAKSRQPTNAQLVAEGLDNVDNIHDLPSWTGLTRTQVSQGLQELRNAGYDLSYWER